MIDAWVLAWNDGVRRGVFTAEKFTIDVTRTPPPRFDLLKTDQYTYLGVQQRDGKEVAMIACRATGR